MPKSVVPAATELSAASAVGISAKSTATAVPVLSAATASSVGLFSGLLNSLGLGRSGNRAVPPWDGSVLTGVLEWARREIESLFFNKTPTADPAQMSQTGDGVVKGTLNAADANGDPLAFQVTSAPLHGTVVVGDDGLYTYTASPEFAEEGGADSFVVQVRDLGLHLNFWVPSSVSVTVPVTVLANAVPVQSAPTTVFAPSRLTGLVSGVVHVSDPNDNPLTYAVTTEPTKGSVTVDEYGQFLYRPTEAAREAASARNAQADARNDFFFVTASDGAGSVAVPVSVSVAPFDDTNIDTIDVGGRPQAVVFTADGSAAYVANLNGTVTIIDTKSRTSAGAFEVGGEPSGLALSPDGATLYVAQSASGSVSAVDVATGNIDGDPIAVGERPESMVIDPAGAFLYVANVNSQSVSAISTADGSVQNIAVGSSPYDLAISSDGAAVYVANFADGTVSIIDTTTNTPVGEPIAVGGNPSALALSADGGTLYVTDYQKGTLLMMGLADESRSIVKVGDNPIAVTPSADGTRIYVVNGGGNTVSVVDITTEKVLKTVDVGMLPVAAEFIPGGDQIYVVNSNSGTLTDISVVQNLSDIANSTNHFEVYNRTSHAITYTGAWAGGGDIDGGPAVGTVIGPGQSVGFEIVYTFLSPAEVHTIFRTVDSPNVLNFVQSMYVGPLGGSESTCFGYGGMKCDAGGSGIYMLDPVGTVITIPAAPDPNAAQSEFLQKYCYSGSPLKCSFEGTNQLKTKLDYHPTGIVVENGGPTEVAYSITKGYTAHSGGSVTVGGSAGVTIKEIVSAEIHADYTHEWGEDHTWEYSLSIPVPPGWYAEFEISDPIYENYGDFTLTMGNTTWLLPGAVFTSPDFSGDTVAKWRVVQKPCDTPTCGAE